MIPADMFMTFNNSGEPCEGEECFQSAHQRVDELSNDFCIDDQKEFTNLRGSIYPNGRTDVDAASCRNM